MKKTFTTLVAVFAITHFAYGQYWSGGPTGPVYYSSGNVGIGTTSPGAKLQINSPAGAAYAPVLNFTEGGNPTYGFSFLQDDLTTGDLQLNRVNAGTSTQMLTFQRITGNVGIGASPNLTIGATSLQVDGVGAGQGAFFNANGAAGQQAQFRGYINGAFEGSVFYTSTQGVFSTNSLPIGLSTNSGSSNAVTLLTNGNVGIGTTSPNYKLEVSSAIALGTGIGSVSGMSGYTNTLAIAGDGGATSAAGIQLGDNSSSGSRQWGIYNSMNTSGSLLGSLNFMVSSGVNTDALTGFTAMTLTRTGFVGIGTTTPHEALSVNGDIRSKQVKVELVNWPDYVFKPTYSLPSLLEVKTYIDKYQHLPDMPSEAEVAKDGLNLGEINKLLTKKVEELTLYLIKQDKEITQQNSKAAIQQKQIDGLKQQVEAITKALNKN